LTPTPLARDFWNDENLLRWDFVLLRGGEVPREAREHPLLTVQAEDGGWHLVAVRQPTPGRTKRVKRQRRTSERNLTAC
jgi:hypothetical protein